MADDNTIPTTLELVTAADGYGIESPSAVQTAICLALDGLSLDGLWDDPDVRSVFGDVRPPEVKPLKVVLVAASRALKTKMCAAAMLRSALVCDVGVASPGDEIRLSVLGPDLDKAKPGFSNMLALIERRFPALLRDTLKQSFRVTRNVKTGLSVEVTLAALVRGGGGLIARWCAGALFSEAPRMVGEDEGARNIDESLTALENRMLPGSIVILEGSPYAPWGPVHDLDRGNFGRPTPELLVIRAPGPLLWPARYTKTYCDQIRARDERAYQADVEGRYVDPEDSLIATVDIDTCITRELSFRPPRKRQDGSLACEYVAAMDPATRGNAWTMVVLGTTGENERGETYEQALAVQWQGTRDKPLKPSVVLAEAKKLCEPYGIDSALSDQASFDALADIGEHIGFSLTGLFGSDDSAEADCNHVRAAVADHRIALLDHPQQRTDLQRIKRRVTANGTAYQYPQSGDGRHCDFVPSLGRAIRFAPPPPAKAAKPGAPMPRKPPGGGQRGAVRTLTG